MPSAQTPTTPAPSAVSACSREAASARRESARARRAPRAVARDDARQQHPQVTALVYLSEVAGGGETEFPERRAAAGEGNEKGGEAPLRVTPRPGRLLIFHNCYPGEDRRHPATLHAGCPVAEGQKWAFNLWYHHQKYV